MTSPGTNEQNPIAIARVLYLRKWLILAVVAVFAATAAAVATFIQPMWTTVALLYPTKQGQPAGLSSLLSLGEKVGLSAPMPTQDPSDILTNIAVTNTFLDAIANKRFISKTLGRPAYLHEIFRVKAENERLTRYYLLEALRKRIEFSLDKHSGILAIRVTTPEPDLSRDLADTVIHDLNVYYRKLVSSKKRTYREFMEKRVQDAEQSLRESEDRMKDYRERNLLASSSPEIMLQLARSQRDVRIDEELYLTLRKEFEVARLEEQKDLPALDILDEPQPPLFKASPIKRKIVMFFGFLGLVAGAILAILLENRKRIARVMGEITRRSGS